MWYNLFMEMKICSKCHENKNIDCFRLRKNKNKIIRNSQCRECERELSKEYYFKHKEERKEKVSSYGKEYRKREKYKEYQRKYRDEHKEELKDYNINYRLDNKDKIKAQRKLKYLNNKEEINCKNKERYRNDEDFSNRIKQRAKEYYQKVKDTEEYKKTISDYRERNKEHIKEVNKKYNIDNKEIISLKKKLFYEEHKKDVIWNLKKRLRNNIRDSFNRKGHCKSSRTREIVGIDLNELSYYLLGTFENNYGYEWDGIEEVHIDHIIPLSTVNTKEEVIKLCHYTNLQLLKGKDNLEKSDRLDWTLNKKGE